MSGGCNFRAELRGQAQRFSGRWIGAPGSSRMQRYHDIGALFDAPGDTLHIAIGGPGGCYEAATGSGTQPTVGRCA